MFINDVCVALEKASVAYAIVGGFAVALHGVLRGTVDVDVALQWSLENLQKAENALKEMGLVSLIPIDSQNLFHFRDEYIQKRNLIAWNFYDPTNLTKQVDLIITYDLKNMHQTKLVNTASGKVRILARGPLIAMKKASGRPQDIEDVKSLEAL